MTDGTHVNDGQLVRAIDGEMSAAEHAEFEAHLVRCDACLERYETLAELSNEIERAIDATAVQAPRGAREQLVKKLAGEQVTAVIPQPALSRWWWAAAVAASAAVLYVALGAPKQAAFKPDAGVAQHDMQAQPAPPMVEKAPAVPAKEFQQPNRTVARASGRNQHVAESADTSAFIRLPYVDAAEPMQAAGLVRVQMKLSMLANAGVIRMMPGASDAPVQADLLLGLDGQPYAIRLVSASQ
jgi:hypothetical protein